MATEDGARRERPAGWRGRRCQDGTRWPQAGQPGLQVRRSRPARAGRGREMERTLNGMGGTYGVGKSDEGPRADACPDQGGARTGCADITTGFTIKLNLFYSLVKYCIM